MLPAPAEGAGCAKTMEPEDCTIVKENLEGKMNLESITLANTLDIRTMSNQMADSVLEQISQPGPAPASKENFQGSAANPPTSQGRMESRVAEGILPAMGLIALPAAHPSSPGQSTAQSRVPKARLRQVRCVTGELKSPQKTQITILVLVIVSLFPCL